MSLILISGTDNYQIINSINNKNISIWLDHILNINETIIYDIEGEKICPT